MTLEEMMPEVNWKHMTSDLQPGQEVYLLCPVRKATAEEREFLEYYKSEMSARNFNAHYPATDTNQEADLGGYRICMDHCSEEERATQIHIYWKEDSTGSYVDLGTCLFLHYKYGKKIKVINRKRVEKIVAEHESAGIMKSYEHVILYLDNLSKPCKS